MLRTGALKAFVDLREMAWVPVLVGQVPEITLREVWKCVLQRWSFSGSAGFTTSLPAGLLNEFMGGGTMDHCHVERAVQNLVLIGFERNLSTHVKWSS